MDEDIKLIEEYLAGSDGAIEELVRRYQKQLYAFIFRMVNDMEETKDLTQKTFINAMRGIRGFKRESSFKTWLYQIALNTCRNHIRQDRYEKVELNESILSNQAGTLTALIEKEERAQVKRGMNELPKRQRLRSFSGRSMA